MAKTSRATIRTAVHRRIRRKVSGTTDHPRLAVYRSLNHIYAQVIDDERGLTLVSASTAEKDLRGSTGGNIDARILSDVLLRNLLRDGRLLRLQLAIPDRPGVLADIAGKIGNAGGNIIEVSHQRLHASSSVQAADLGLMIEARDSAHAAGIIEALEKNYIVRRE